MHYENRKFVTTTDGGDLFFIGSDDKGDNGEHLHIRIADGTFLCKRLGFVKFKYTDARIVGALKNEMIYILLTKTTAAQNEVALSYHNVRGLYFLVVVFVGTIVTVSQLQ